MPEFEPSSAGSTFGLPVLILLAAFGLAACSTIPRKPAPPTLLAQVAPVGFSSTVRFLGYDRDSFLKHADETIGRLGAAAGGGPIRVLALSGGGAGGAFAAGALIGMTRRGERPQFHVVTGVSAGALIAPFAFLGPAWDDELKEAFDSYRPSRLLRPRGWLAFLFLPGYYRGEPLVDLVDHFVTDRLIQAVAEQAAQGRLLLVATTDLDKEESVIWDMGAIAARGGEPARRLFRDVLIASASIPGLFPPVLIHVEGGGNSYDEMHVDGGTTLSFFVAPEIAQQEKKHFPELERAQVFVLVNGQLSTYPETTRERPISVLARSFSAGLTHASRRSLELTAAFADRYQMDFRFTYVPVTYPFKGPLDFKFPSMHALFEFGAHCAEAGRLWTTLQQAMSEAQHAAATPSQLTDDCPVSNAGP